MLKLQKAGQLQDVVTAQGGTGTWGCGPAGEQPLEGQDPGGAEDIAAIVCYLRSLRRRCVTQVGGELERWKDNSNVDDCVL